MAAKAKFNRARGSWAVLFNQHNTRWYETVADEGTARALAKGANDRMRKGEDLRPASKRGATPGKASAADTVRAFGDRWLVNGWSERKMATNNQYERMLRLYVYPALGDIAIVKLTRAACIAFLQGLLTKRRADKRGLIKFKTREGIHLTLSALLGAAVDAGIIDANPAARLVKHRTNPDEIRDEICVWTPTEADRFLETVRARRPEYYAFFFVALRTGLRIGELAELQWDLDFKIPHAIHVQRAYTANKRTTIALGADGTYTIAAIEGASPISTPKGKRGRLVDTSVEVERVLAHHRIDQRAIAFKRRYAMPALTFTTPIHGRRINGRNLRADILGPMIKAARVPVIDIHGLRHTYASILLSRGESLDYVSRQLGHANATTTERIYRHFIPANAAEVAARRRRLDDAWKVDGDEK